MTVTTIRKCTKCNRPGLTDSDFYRSGRYCKNCTLAYQAGYYDPAKRKANYHDKLLAQRAAGVFPQTRRTYRNPFSAIIAAQKRLGGSVKAGQSEGDPPKLLLKGPAGPLFLTVAEACQRANIRYTESGEVENVKKD